MTSDVDFMVKEIDAKLLGATIRNAVRTPDGNSFGFELVSKAKGRGNYDVFTVWVDCDAEGNGPGWLNIGEKS